MIIEQIIDENTVLHFSDQGMKIRQVETGFLFDEAGDFIPCIYTYAETDIPLDPQVEPEPELSAEETLDIITGKTV